MAQGYKIDGDKGAAIWVWDQLVLMNHKKEQGLLQLVFRNGYTFNLENIPSKNAADAMAAWDEYLKTLNM